jgi:hypothetical protein
LFFVGAASPLQRPKILRRRIVSPHEQGAGETATLSQLPLVRRLHPSGESKSGRPNRRQALIGKRLGVVLVFSKEVPDSEGEFFCGLYRIAQECLLISILREGFIGAYEAENQLPAGLIAYNCARVYVGEGKDGVYVNCSPVS